MIWQASARIKLQRFGLTPRASYAADIVVEFGYGNDAGVAQKRVASPSRSGHSSGRLAIKMVLYPLPTSCGVGFDEPQHMTNSRQGSYLGKGTAARMRVAEQSDHAKVPMKRLNKEGKTSAEVVEGRVWPRRTSHDLTRP